jgi:uncharacterized protein
MIERTYETRTKRGPRGPLLAVLLVLTLAASARAQEFVPPAPTGFVNDYAKVIDPASAARMETMARNFRDRTQIDVAVVTLPSLQGRPLEEVGLEIGRKWKIGAGEEKNGLLIFISIEERRSRIEVSRHLEDEITDGTAGAILRQARPAFQQGQYGPGLSGILESVLATIASKQGISIEGIDASRAVRSEEPRESGGNSGTIVFIVLFLLFILFNYFRGGGGGRGRGGRRRRWGGGMTIIIPGGGWGGGSSWSGGGGGDSWGGFGGGGDFGGGGASSDW